MISLRNIIRVKKPVFADLDGTLIETVSGKAFPESVNDWKIKEGVLQALHNYGCTSLHIVTNQGGIEMGFVNREEWFDKINNIIALLHKKMPGVKIYFDVCTSNDKNNPMRKPNPGMVIKWTPSFYKPSRCIMIGDASGLPGQFSDSDRKCAENANIGYMDIEEFINKYK